MGQRGEVVAHSRQWRPRATSISSHKERSERGAALGLYFVNGVLHPPHMAEPGEDGYRTPTGEDLERHAQLRWRLDQTIRNGKLQAAAKCKDTGNSRIAWCASEDSEKTMLPYSSGEGDGSNSSSGGNGQKYVGIVRSKAKEVEDRLLLNCRQRLKHFTWTFFTITMATGGIANVIYHVPFRFSGLYTIGCFFFILNIVLFLINVLCISLRFHFHRNTFRNSFMHPTESLFIPAAVVSFGTILMNISQYGEGIVGNWLDTAIMVLFWVDVGLAVVASFGIYLLMWSTQTFTIATMTPIWIFPAYPLLIIGPHAGVLSADLLPEASARILVGGFTCQGIGFLVSLMIYAAFIYRLMTQKLPRESLRPGMFVSVGPSGFTASGLVNMAANAQRTYGGTDFLGDGSLAAMIMSVVANWTALWCWGLACWFFFVSVGAHYTCFGHDRMPFAMTWFSFVFPQTALVTSMFAIGQAFRLRPLQILGCVMTVMLVCMWLFVVGMMIRAIYLKHILWPQKGEDKDEGGFRGSPDRTLKPDETLPSRETGAGEEMV